MPSVTQNWQAAYQLQQSTGSDRILALNGYRAMVPCYFSPCSRAARSSSTYDERRCA